MTAVKLDVMKSLNVTLCDGTESLVVATVTVEKKIAEVIFFILVT